VNGLALDLVGTLPLQGRWAAFAGLGVNNAKVRQSFSGTAMGTGLVNDSERGWNQKYGIGLRYAVSDTLALRAELERYGLEDNAILKNPIETLTLGVVYRFGARAPEAPAERAPVSVAPTPTPPPAPPVTLPIELTLSAASLFDFDRTEIKPEGAQALDKLVADMRTLDYELVLVTGHTDRIGSRDYNLGLSQRRADAVKAYLVNAGIPADRITTRGVNSDEPVTRPEDCRGTGSAQAQIACLEPDRRVVVMVTGTDEP
jgi:OOP family OmpA-OmpF porin